MCTCTTWTPWTGPGWTSPRPFRCPARRTPQSATGAPSSWQAVAMSPRSSRFALATSGAWTSWSCVGPCRAAAAPPGAVAKGTRRPSCEARCTLSEGANSACLASTKWFRWTRSSLVPRLAEVMGSAPISSSASAPSRALGATTAASRSLARWIAGSTASARARGAASARTVGVARIAPPSCAVRASPPLAAATASAWRAAAANACQAGMGRIAASPCRCCRRVVHWVVVDEAIARPALANALMVGTDPLVL
mmetsp:Transcript_81129/g.262850  ORF Transcript_81129/g.262850 Transcript_81129/m.262850 type:complete len:252 (-) Transcript_81129:505-1260(-)